MADINHPIFKEFRQIYRHIVDLYDDSLADRYRVEWGTAPQNIGTVVAEFDEALPLLFDCQRRMHETPNLSEEERRSNAQRMVDYLGVVDRRYQHAKALLAALAKSPK